MIWKINTLEYTNDSDKGVIKAHWDCSKVDGGYAGRCYGAESFAPDPASEDYIAYADLTEETVLGWIYAKIDKDAIEANVQAQIDGQLSPTTLKGLPW